MPALMARRALERVKPGESLEVITDDPMAPVDMPHMCRQEGFEFVSLAKEETIARMVLRRPESPP